MRGDDVQKRYRSIERMADILAEQLCQSGHPLHHNKIMFFPLNPRIHNYLSNITRCLSLYAIFMSQRFFNICYSGFTTPQVQRKAEL